MNDIVPLQGEVVETTPIKDIQKVPDLPQELRSTLAERVKNDWEDIIGAQIELAKGIYRRDKVFDKETGQSMIAPVYEKAPDRDAGQYIINQAIGKPKENTVIEGKVTFLMDI